MGYLFSATEILFPIYFKEYVSKLFPNQFYLRDTQIHSRGFFTVINNAQIIIKPEYRKNIQQLILTNKENIIKMAIKKSKSTTPAFSKTNLFPVRYIKVFIYERDKRIRHLRFSGIPDDMICTIEVNNTKTILSNDFDGIPQQIGQYRIVWNQKWIEQQKTKHFTV
ncbi:hypothetical protein [Arcicella rosea]|uniref:Uncharacterized protein n=1 Tax=Arcicella rosea TaxID=502909 RepID=A0A841EQZ9_9BACT|nr:hypothetical protein [Arcicella rosea]MBB6003799.1 hypothetical protein [Arcicella rosea]